MVVVAAAEAGAARLVQPAILQVCRAGFSSHCRSSPYPFIGTRGFLSLTSTTGFAMQARILRLFLRKPDLQAAITAIAVIHAVDFRRASKALSCASRLPRRALKRLRFSRSRNGTTDRLGGTRFDLCLEVKNCYRTGPTPASGRSF